MGVWGCARTIMTHVCTLATVATVPFWVSDAMYSNYNSQLDVAAQSETCTARRNTRSLPASYTNEQLLCGMAALAGGRVCRHLQLACCNPQCIHSRPTKSLQKLGCIQFLCQRMGCECVGCQCSSCWLVHNTSQSSPLTKIICSLPATLGWCGKRWQSPLCTLHLQSRPRQGMFAHRCTCLCSWCEDTNENISVMHLTALQLAIT